MSEHKLRSGVNWHGEIKQKGIKQTHRKELGVWEARIKST